MAPKEDSQNFYYKIAKNLTFNLPEERDRVIASKWIQKIIISTAETEKSTKNHVLQLLLLSLQRKCLVGPFTKAPQLNKELRNYNWAIQPGDIAKEILFKEFEKAGKPEVAFEISGDLNEFVAYQEIPHFGTHFYYAFSPEPINTWDNLEKEIIPKGFLNIPVISNPDTSILAKTVLETTQKKKESKEKEVNNFTESMKDEERDFVDATILDKVLSKKRMKNTNAKDKKKLKKKIDKLEQITEIEEQAQQEAEKVREAMLAKMPSRLRERLAKKFVPKELEQDALRHPDAMRTPEIFRKGPRPKTYKKWKPEEFGVRPDEQWIPGVEFFNQFPDYQPPSPNGRQQIDLKRLSTFHMPLGKIQASDQKNDSDLIRESWNRSLQKLLEKRQPIETPTLLQSNRRKILLEKLEELKSVQPSRLVFDDIDVNVTPEEIEFERFVYKEFPDDSKNLTILEEEDMPIDDMFGEDNIADINVLPSPPMRAFEEAELLLDEEMETDDIFGEDNLANPDVLFKQVEIETENDQGALRVGKRMLHLMNEEPFEQTYIEGDTIQFDDTLLADRNITPALTDSIYHDHLDKKLRKLRREKTPEKSFSPLRGPWAAKFQRNIERIDRGEEPSLEEMSHRDHTEKSIVESQMPTDGDDHIAVPQNYLEDQRREELQKLEDIKMRFEAEMIKRQRLQKEPVNQDLLEPYIYERIPEPPKTFLDISIEERPTNLQPALVTSPFIKQKGPFESFEHQMDESLKFFKDDSIEHGTPRPKVYLDPDFLERRIQEYEYCNPNEESFLLEDEMNFDDVFDDQNITQPLKIHEIPIPTPPLKPQIKNKIPPRTQLVERSKQIPKAQQFKLSDGHSYPKHSFLKYDTVHSSIDNFVEDITPPELVSGISETPTIYERSYPSFLKSFEIKVPDGEANIELSPKNVISPTKYALFRSVKSSIDFINFKNKLRQLKGLQLEYPELKFTAVKQYQDFNENLLDGAQRMSFRSELRILDESVLEDNLLSPLLKSPLKRPKRDPLASYEEQIMKNTEDDQFNAMLTSEQSNVSYILEDDMSDMFGEDMIAEPLPIRQIPVTSTPKKIVDLSQLEQIENISIELFSDPQTLDSVETYTEETSRPDSLHNKSEHQSYKEKVDEDKFDEENISPDQTMDAQIKMALDESARATLNVQRLRDRLSNIKQPKHLSPIREEDSCDREQLDPFESYERKLDESIKRMQAERMHTSQASQMLERSHPSHLEFNEMEISNFLGPESVMSPNWFKDSLKKRSLQESFRKSGIPDDMLFEEEMEDIENLFEVAESQPTSRKIPNTRTPLLPKISQQSPLDDESFPEDFFCEADDIPDSYKNLVEHVSRFSDEPPINQESYQESYPSFLESHDIFEKVTIESSPHKVMKSPTQQALQKSILDSVKFFNFKNRFNKMTGRPCKIQKLSQPQLTAYLDYKEDLLDTVHNFDNLYYEKGILDQTIEEEQLVQPILTPIADKFDPFESFERDCENELECLSSEVTILEDYEMEDQFGSDMIQSPIPLRDIPYPDYRPYQRLKELVTEEDLDRQEIPELLATPTSSGRQSAPLEDSNFVFATGDESFYKNLLGDVYDPDIFRKEPLITKHNASVLDSAEMDDLFRRFDYLKSEAKNIRTPENSRCASKIEDSTWKNRADDQVKGIMKRAAEARRRSFEMGTPITSQSPTGWDSPIGWYLNDSIGPPDIPEPGLSPGHIQFREIAPGHLVIDRPVDRQRFAEFEKKYIAKQFGAEVDDLYAEDIGLTSPPRLSLSEMYEETPTKIYDRSSNIMQTPVTSRQKRRRSRIRLFHSRTDNSNPSLSESGTPFQDPVQMHSFGRPKHTTLGSPEEPVFPALQPPRLSIHMDPTERMKEFIKKLPRVEVEFQPRKSGLSPLQCTTRILPPKEELLEEEQFPEFDDMSNITLGHLANALYIPTEEEDRSIKRREQELLALTPPEPSRPRHIIEEPWMKGTEMQPGDEGFKWLGKMAPFDSGVAYQATKRSIKPAKLPPTKQKKLQPLLVRKESLTKTGNLASNHVRRQTQVPGKVTTKISTETISKDGKKKIRKRSTTTVTNRLKNQKDYQKK